MLDPPLYNNLNYNTGCVKVCHLIIVSLFAHIGAAPIEQHSSKHILNTTQHNTTEHNTTQHNTLHNTI